MSLLARDMLATGGGRGLGSCEVDGRIGGKEGMGFPF